MMISQNKTIQLSNITTHTIKNAPTLEKAGHKSTLANNGITIIRTDVPQTTALQHNLKAEQNIHRGQNLI